MLHKMMSGTKRVTVRLDHRQTTRLCRLCDETGLDRSELVRLALDQFKVASVQREIGPRSMADNPAVGVAVAQDAPTQNGPSATATPMGSPEETAIGSGAFALLWQAKLLDLLGTYRAFGMQIWKERRSLYQRLFAAAIVAGESNENPRDIALCETLRRIGKEYNLL